MKPLDKWGVHFEVNFLQWVLKMRLIKGNQNILVMRGDVLIIYDKYWENKQFQSIHHHIKPKDDKKGSIFEVNFARIRCD